MRKIKLNLDGLAVESFATSGAEEDRGTILAHGSLACTGQYGNTCDGGRTCVGYTCDGAPTCNYRSCDTVCGSHFCGTGDESCEFSCVWTCELACSDGHTYSCVPEGC